MLLTWNMLCNDSAGSSVGQSPELIRELAADVEAFITGNDRQTHRLFQTTYIIITRGGCQIQIETRRMCIVFTSDSS